jgi:ABC-type transport system involved in multi-copper enzyme maturation permease subunit
MLRIAFFELRYQLRQPLLWVMFLFFALMTFFATATDGVQIGGAIGQVHRNAPWVIVRMLGIMSVVSVFITTVFVAGAILRDFERRSQELVFSRPIGKRSYLLGRFLGACLVSTAVFLAVPFGALLGSLMPWIAPEQLGPTSLLPYLWALGVIGVPNLVFTASVFFSLASATRSMLATYLGVVGFFTFFFLSGRMLSDLESADTAALLDPFGMRALSETTKYWTIVEKNSILPEISGLLVTNRLLWLGVGLLILGLAFLRFRMSTEQRPLLRLPWRRQKKAPDEGVGRPEPVLEPVPAVTRRFDFGAAFRQFLRQTRLEVTSVFKGALFITLVAFGLFNLLGGLSFFERMFGTAVYPVTRLMIEGIEGSFVFLLVIIVTFYSGELIWKERTLDLAGVYDAMPVPSWVYLGAKLVAQLLVVFGFLAIGVLATVGYQAWHGYTRFEFGVYGQGFLVTVMPFVLVCFLASFLQVASGSKFLGYALMILYIISQDVLEALDFDHFLYRYGFAPDAPYSDMNGYGHFVAPLFWFNLYWVFAAVALLCLTILFWQRGTDTAWRTRLRIARHRFRGPVRAVLAASVVAFLATGAWIYYNTNVLNEYLADDDVEARQADYEKKYRQYKDVDLPRITDVYVEVDIFPEERRVEARGRYLLVNENPRPLTEIHVTVPPRVNLHSLDFPAHSEELNDEIHGYRIYQLEEPLAPGASMEFRFDLAVENRGFVTNRSDNQIVRNGTFFNNTHYFPSFGYDGGNELLDPNDRRKHDLPPVHRFPKIDDDFARRNTYVAHDADWIDFETVVSTTADQIAIAPGYLQKEWTEGDRRYFHYKMDSPILPFYSYLSADYTVKRDRWQDVAIEVYYHEPHDYNVDRMIDSIKKSLAYFEANFSPYQHRQMRIIEFPRYARFAQSFPNTVPFSESIGFIAKLDDDEDEPIDYPFYVTAHEVAHQWWAHQVIGGFVQGATLLSETMAQYSALMVMEKEYGPEKMRRFLKYELDRYLSDRGGELVEEMPLKLVENQPYIHYRKGSVVMYALRDFVGEENLNRALAEYVEAVKFQEPPFTNSVEFLDYVRRAVPPEKEALITDLFEEITLFENEIEEAIATRRDDGRYAVTVAAKAKKLRADGQGVETEIPIDDWIEVGVFGEDESGEETVLYLEKHRVTETEPTFTVVVDERPVRAGIDPYHKLVDRNTDDNVERVEEGDGGLEAVAAGA